MDGWIDPQDRCMVGWMDPQDGWMDGWMDIIHIFVLGLSFLVPYRKLA